MRFAVINTFIRQKAGNIAVIVALSLIPVMIASGAVVDLGRAYMVKSRLSSALDAAGLAVGSSVSNDDLPGVLTRFFNANYPADKLGVPVNPSLSIDDGVIQISATATVETTFLKLITLDTITVRASSKIIRETTGLEIVLVLDNTGSMFFNGKIGALRDAAQEMVDIVFGSDDAPENLFMGLVPFVTTVNIGNTDVIEQFKREPNPPNIYPVGTADGQWKGCVEARNFPNDTNDVYIQGDAQRGEWAPYFWEAETFNIFGQINTFCTNRWWRPSENPFQIPPLPRPTGRSGDPPFSSGLGGPGTFENIDITPPSTGGPNKACPQPLTPLTNSRATLEAAISTMTPWFGNGTMANLGAVWGWRVLSPTPPFTEGKPYDDPKINKVLVILTDGVNFFSGVNLRCFFFANRRYNSQYTGYGYASEERLGPPNSFVIQQELNNRLASTCENIKAEGITIYTIVFQLNDNTTQDLFRNCASDPEKFFNSPDNQQLNEAFRSIGAELRNLRIAE